MSVAGLGGGLGVEDDLGLGDLGDEAAFGVADGGLPGLGAAAAMEGDAFGGDDGSDEAGCEEVGFGFDGGGAGALGEVERGADRAEGIGEGHDGTAVEDAGDGAEFVANGELCGDALGGGGGEADAEEAWEEWLDALLQGVEGVVGHGCEATSGVLL